MRTDYQTKDYFEAAGEDGLGTKPRGDEWTGHHVSPRHCSHRYPDGARCLHDAYGETCLIHKKRK